MGISLDETVKLVQIIWWSAATITAIVTLWKVIGERKDQRRWKKAEHAKELIDDLFASPRAKSAMKMIEGRTGKYKIGDDDSIEIGDEDVNLALEASDEASLDKQAEIIRDSFDSLFYHLGRIGYYVNRQLVDFEDVEHPIDYYVELIAKSRPKVIRNYLEKYKFHRTLSFFAKFDVWVKSSQQ